MTSEACREMRGQSRRSRARQCRSRARRWRCSAHLDGCAECRAEFRELAVGRGCAPARRPVASHRWALAAPAGVGGSGARPRFGRAWRCAVGSRTRRRVAVAAATVTAIAAALLAFVLVVPGSSPAGTQVVFASHNGSHRDATLAPARGRDRGRVPRCRPARRATTTGSGSPATTAIGSRRARSRAPAPATHLVMTAALPLRRAAAHLGHRRAQTMSCSTSSSGVPAFGV